MTNQASELDKAIMIGFLYGIQSDLLPEDEVVHRMVAFSHTKGYKEALAIIRTEKLKLLAEVRERVVGEDVPEFHDPGCYQYNGLEYCHCSAKPDKAANELRSDQRNEITKLEAEL